MREKKVLVVHDFDFPLFTKKTCFRRAFWLIVYALFGRFQWVRDKMPRWLMYEKYSQAKALAVLNKLLGVDAVFAFKNEIDKAFPNLRNEIAELGFKVIDHWHAALPSKGYNEWEARGEWDEILKEKTYLNYDRHYIAGKRAAPEKGTNVIWHVDHMPFNMFFYLEFLRETGLIG